MQICSLFAGALSVNEHFIGLDELQEAAHLRNALSNGAGHLRCNVAWWKCLLALLGLCAQLRLSGEQRGILLHALIAWRAEWLMACIQIS